MRESRCFGQAMIKELRAEYPLAVLCRVLGVSRQADTTRGSCGSRRGARNQSAVERWRRGPRITRTRQTYGAMRLQRELAADGFAASLGTIKRLRRELGLRCVQQKRRFRVVTTDSRHQLPVAA